MAGAQPGDAAPPQPPSELRLAVAFTGGVSLAVWMGGVAREMNLLLAASRLRRGEPVADTSGQARKVREGYATLLRLLNVDCTMDVLSGTSAGGINAVVLGLANVQRFDLDGLRQLWFEQGSLGTLLRDPADKKADSLLYGDKGLLKGLADGLARLAGTGPGNPAAAEDPTRVFITTTLLAGDARRFTDEYGTLIRDTDHQGLFSFSGGQLTRGNLPALALAARCSASFPIAFEPGFIPVGASSGDSHPDMSAFTHTPVAQFAADGGLLANRPLRPALQAVFDRPADRDVRRVLAFVVPATGGGGPTAAAALADPPDLTAALAAGVNAVMSQSISADLTAIAAHNQEVRSRDDARQQLALLGAKLDRLGAPFYDSYRTRRADSVAQAAADEVVKRATAGRSGADGRPAGFGADSGHARSAALNAALAGLPSRLPRIGDYDGMNAAGRDALDEGKATVVALLSRAYQLMPSAAGKLELGKLRAEAGAVMPPRQDETHADTITRTLRVSPLLPAAVPETAAAAAAQALLNANMQAGPSRQPWRELATVIVRLRGMLPAASLRDGAATGTATAGQPADQAGAFLRDLLIYLTGPGGDSDVDRVAARLFDLQVARYALQLDGVVADQALELIQMSSDTRTLLDHRTLAAEKLTGLQLHHFGAFYKASWRANDWMWGRLDGAGWLVHMLLDPRRIRQLAAEAPDPGVFRETLRASLEALAGTPPPPGVWTPFPHQAQGPAIPAEMEFLTADRPLPASLPMTSMWVAGGLQRLIAGEELAQVARMVEADKAAGAQEAAAAAFVTAYRSAAGTAPGGSYPEVPEERAAAVLNACRVSAEKLTGEIGSELFSRTVTRSVAVAAKAADLGKAMPAFLRPVLTGVRSTTLLAYRVTSVGPAARYPLFAGLGLIALGILASTSTVNVLSAAGLAAVLAGLLLVAVGAARRIVLALGIVTVAAGAALAAAAYVPAIRDPVFRWLLKTAVPRLEKHPAEWAILVLFVLLPPLWTIVQIIRAVISTGARRQRRQGTAPEVAAAVPESAPASAPTS